MGSDPPQFMDDRTPEVREHRTPEYDADPLFLNRWSPRSMTGEPIAHDELMALFEAARWAPSSRNNQHWRFIYATPDTPAWDDFVDLLSTGNQRWAPNAAALIVIVSKTTNEDGSHARTHSYDTGAAWENLFLEGVRRGFAVHGIAGFDTDRAPSVVNLPPDHHIEAMAAVGHRGPKDALPADLQEKEYPNGRRPLADLVFEGTFPE